MTSYYYEDSTISLDSMGQNILGSVAKESRGDLEKL